ncbi:helix-turn-helix transcriptional regulator [Streptacidiphilus sp. PB12-B1b]|uniref:helix-turn-helix transcriptional regulator n=1 Tax=Streptacidiphilus sp. PB12-B1b TaxID=2705012 RepID=UPI0015FAB089|nr:helix-turn-helix transcriptional regulator [Streptacidiphilus sp. PB12-B1b]
MNDPDYTAALRAAHALDEVDLAVYGWALEHQSADPDEVAAAVGVTPSAVELSVDRLLRSQLLHVSPANPAIVLAVGPDTAIGRLAAPVEAQIREQEQQLAAMRKRLGGFVPSYHRHRSRTESLEVLANVHDVRNALNRASDECSKEVLACQPGGGARVPEAMQEALVRDRAMLERGIQLRTLYHHTARFNGPSQAYVAAATALGGQYRTAHELFGRLIVFDRELAFIPVRGDSWGAVMIREPCTVDYLCDLFEQTWERATPFADAASQGLEEVAREIHETIIQLLGAGLKDEAIARRLGMSLRTARRHIAGIMEELDAASRFQAGAQAALRGLLGADLSEQPCPDSPSPDFPVPASVSRIS